jgi:hypothetical protein
MTRLKMLACLVVFVLGIGPCGQFATAQSSFDSLTQEQLDAVFFQLMDTVMQALWIDWGNWLSAEWNMPIPVYNAFLVESDETYTSACGDKITYTYQYNNAEYCYYNQVEGSSNNGIIIIPIGSMIRMSQGDIWGRPLKGENFPGMYATVAITAHEFGHFLNFEIWEWFTLQGYDIQLADPPNVELLADCIAGEFMDTYNASTNYALTPTDVSNMVTSLELLADPTSSAGTHGTADQRALAFLQGYTTQPDPYGAPAPLTNQSSDVGKRLCIDTYWP